MCTERDAHICTNNFIKSEAIKEFADKLKNTYFIDSERLCCQVDKVLKEMVGNTEWQLVKTVTSEMGTDGESWRFMWWGVMSDGKKFGIQVGKQIHILWQKFVLWTIVKSN